MKTVDIRCAPVKDFIAPVRAGNLEHVTRHRRRTDKLGIVLASCSSQVAIDEAIIIEPRDRVRSIEWQGVIRLLELPNEVFSSGRKDGSSWRGTANTTTETDVSP